MARLRKVLKLPQAEKRHFKKRDVTAAHLIGAKSDIRFLHVPLVMAERAWAFAMALRQESNTEPRKRFHLIAKLRKSCSYALQLQELCNVSTVHPCAMHSDPQLIPSILADGGVRCPD